MAGDAVAVPGDGEPATGAAASCSPRAVGGPHWLTEGEVITIRFECESGAALDDGVLEIADLPGNAVYDASRRSLTFSPTLDQAGVYDVRLKIAGSEEVGHLEIQVADAVSAVGNAPVDPIAYTLELGIPVLHLDVAEPSSETYVPASVVYRGHVFEGAEAKYRGQTSLGYPKKSYTLKFARADLFGDLSAAAGFTGKRRVTLTTTFDDKSYLRTRMAFQLWNELDGGHIQVQAYSVVVYLRGVYQGLYTLTDHVDGDLMRHHGLFEDGNLYKARTHDANFRLTEADGGRRKAVLSQGFEKQEGYPSDGAPGAYADLEDLVQWVATAGSQPFLAGLPQRLASDEYGAWWLLCSLLAAGDSAERTRSTTAIRAPARRTSGFTSCRGTSTSRWVKTG